MPARHENRRAPAPDASYRADIDGLRALAVLLIVVYHVWLGRVSGGVDVFLMISAFFLTTTFARRMHRGEPLRPLAWWTRTFRRLLPAAAVTILLTLLGTGLIVHAIRWPEIWRQGWASLFYVQNWELAFRSIDYYARVEELPSPLQHFWSLSVQGQVFLLWPVVFVLAAWVVRRTRLTVTTVLGVAFGAIFAASLAFSIVETAADPVFAYFDTRARLWEFALGSLVAIAMPFFRAPAVLRAVLGWLGVVGIVVCGLVLDVRGGFPGYLALWPTLCTAAVVLAGGSASRGGPTALLSSGPLRFLARDAYALYLVHWPILILTLTVQGRTKAGPLTGLVVIAASLGVARALSALVEHPLREGPRATASPVRSLGVIALSIVLVAVPLTGWQVAQRGVVDGAEADAREAARVHAAAGAAARAAEAAPPPGAELGDLARTDAPIVPTATTLDQEWVALGPPCEGRFAVGDDARPGSEPLVSTCRQSPLVEDPERTILIVGSSHTEQQMGALVPLAEANGWQLVSLLLGGCTLAPGDVPVGPDAEDCPAWREAAIGYALEIRPDAVMTVATTTFADGREEELQRGIVGVVDRLAAEGIQVLLGRDNPRFAFDPYVCMSEYGRDAPQCRVPVDQVLAARNPAGPLAGDGVVVFDLSTEICPDGVCVPVIGNIAVYLDTNHLTETFARALSPALAAQLAAQGFG